MCTFLLQDTDSASYQKYLLNLLFTEIIGFIGSNCLSRCQSIVSNAKCLMLGTGPTNAEVNRRQTHLRVSRIPDDFHSQNITKDYLLQTPPSAAFHSLNVPFIRQCALILQISLIYSLQLQILKYLSTQTVAAYTRAALMLLLNKLTSYFSSKYANQYNTFLINRTTATTSTFANLH